VRSQLKIPNPRTGAVRWALILLLSGWLILAFASAYSDDAWTVGFAVTDENGKALFAARASYALTNNGFTSAGNFSFSRGPAYIRQREPLARRVLLSNETPREQKFLLLEFIDTSAIEFPLDEQKDVAHRVKLAAGERQGFSTELPLVDQGLHNLFLVCLYRLQSASAKLATHFPAYVESLLVGEGPAPQYTAARPKTFLQGRPGQRLRKLLPTGGLLVSTERTPQDARAYTTELQANAGAELKYYIQMRNAFSGHSATEFALITVLDGQQVPVNGDANMPVVNVRLQAGQEITIPVRLTAPAGPGEHELWLLAFGNPYMRKGALPGPGLRYSLRVKLLVQ